MLMTVDQAIEIIKSGRMVSFAGDEKLLDRLPAGNWIAGTIPYFVGEAGGVFTKEKLFATVLPEQLSLDRIGMYRESELEKIPADAHDNGCSLIIIPAGSKAHVQYAENAPNYPGIFMKPIIGWIAGTDLADLGKVTPKVYDGTKKKKSETEAVVLHATLPKNKIAFIGIVNLFAQGKGDVITFDSKGFSITDCRINGSQRNFADYLIGNKTDTRLPLVADYHGTMVNVSFQAVSGEKKTVDLYAPVFPGVTYKIASPVTDYVREFGALIPKGSLKTIFSCNCILNYLYSELEGKKTGDLTGPVTFGEIAYQLLNQTMVYMELQDN